MEERSSEDVTAGNLCRFFTDTASSEREGGNYDFLASVAIETKGHAKI